MCIRDRLGTYAAALFLLKDTFKESVDDPDVFEKEFMKYLKEQGYEIDRPSRILVRVFSDDDKIQEIKVGGQAVMVAEGKLLF